MSLIKPEPLRFEPGTSWAYSNTGMLALSRVIEVATKKNFFEYMEQDFFGRLGLRHANYPDYEADRGGIAKPYDIRLVGRGTIELAVPKERTHWGGAAGDAASSAGDLMRFAQLRGAEESYLLRRFDFTQHREKTSVQTATASRWTLRRGLQKVVTAMDMAVMQTEPAPTSPSCVICQRHIR